MSDYIPVPKDEFLEFLKYRRDQLDQQISAIESGVRTPNPTAPASLIPTGLMGGLAAGRGKKGQAKEKIVHYLTKNPDGASSKKLSEALSLPISSVYINLATLKKEGKIETVNGINKLK